MAMLYKSATDNAVMTMSDKLTTCFSVLDESIVHIISHIVHIVILIQDFLLPFQVVFLLQQV